MREADRRTPWMDWLAGATALIGGSMLLSRRSRAVMQAVRESGDVEIDDTASVGRGQPGAPPSRAAAQVGYETLDADAGTIGKLMLGLAVVALGAVLGMTTLLAFFHRQLQADRPAYTAEQTARIEPPLPQLETNPETDLHREDAGETARLDFYGWNDAAHRTARIPIARAMALSVGQSLGPLQ